MEDGRVKRERSGGEAGVDQVRSIDWRVDYY